jgi:hypothetical protein
MSRFIAVLLISTLVVSPLWADLVTRQSWTKKMVFEGSAERPVIFCPLPRLSLSTETQKVVVVPEKLDLSEEYSEFRLFRNRYVIFGIYIFTSLYYNWLTRDRR